MTSSRKPFRFPEIPDSWQQFFLSLLFQIVLPLIPLMIEQLCTNDISEQSSTITAAIYTITTGISSEQEWQFGLSIVSSLIFSALFGFVIFIAQPQLANNPEILSAQKSALPLIKSLSFWGIGVISVVHGIERFNRHVVDGNSYWNFFNNKNS